MQSRRIKFKKSVVFGALIAIVGGAALLYSSYAAVIQSSLEPEDSSTITGATIGSDAQASGGKYVRFDGGDTLDVSWQAAWDTRDYDTIRNWYLANTGIAASGLADSDLTPSGTVSSTHEGQIIEGLLINGSVLVKHDNVVVRNCKIIGSSDGVEVPFASRDNVNQFFVQNTSLIGDQATIDDPDTSPERGVNGVYAVVHIDRIYVWGRGAGFRLSNQTGDTAKYSMVENIVTHPGSHNTAVSFRGGDDHLVYRNWLEGSTSSALSLYPDAGPITYFTGKENLFDGGSYSVRAGDGKEYAPENHHLKFLDNLFTRNHIYGPRAVWNPDQEGNEWSGNYYLDGELIP